MGDQERTPAEGAEYHNTYQVYHKEGLLSHQSSVVPNAPLLYENQVMTKLRQGSSGGVGDKLQKLEQRLATHTNVVPKPVDIPPQQTKPSFTEVVETHTPTQSQSQSQSQGSSQEDKPTDDSQGEVCML